MRLLAEAVRAAGNVLLTPTTLSQSIAPGSCRRALLVGSRREPIVDSAAAELRSAAPDLSVDIAGRNVKASGLWSLRRRKYDLVCLLLTGNTAAGAAAKLRHYGLCLLYTSPSPRDRS